MKGKWVIKSLALLVLIILFTGVCLADSDDQEFFFKDKVRNEKDAGYSGRITIDKDDPHYGWDLGKFCLSGWTSYVEYNGNIVFLKNVGDRVQLSFILEQNINKLNGKKSLYISADKNGYDRYFGVKQTNFGKGALIIRQTDYQNKVHAPQVYTNYLPALEVGANTTIEFLEEGDYEVTLDYEIGRKRIDIWKLPTMSAYTNYEIFFKFSIRNGNCMVYPFDVQTKGELTEKAYTENGFYLDFAKTKYLDVSIKKEILVDGATGVTEDTRFNKPAKDGEAFTDEGIYTITAYNRYTKQTTTKVIYVGKNNIMKAYVVSGRSIVEIYDMLGQGYTIDDDGTFVAPPAKQIEEISVTPSPTPSPTPVAEISIIPFEIQDDQAPAEKLNADEQSKQPEKKAAKKETIWKVLALAFGAMLLLVLGAWIFTRKKNSKE